MNVNVNVNVNVNKSYAGRFLRMKYNTCKKREETKRLRTEEMRTLDTG
jgi:hypothetical protein